MAHCAPVGMIKFRCHQCGKKIGVYDDIAGKKVWCPHCGVVTTVPQLHSSAEDAHAENDKTQYSVFICHDDQKPIAVKSQGPLPGVLSLEPYG
jgi:hypothetical protein